MALADLGKSSHSELLWLVDCVPEVFDCIERAYLKGRLRAPEIFAELVLFHIRDKRQYERYRLLLLEHEGRQLPEWQPPRNYAAERQQAQQQYFELLFDPAEAQR